MADGGEDSTEERLEYVCFMVGEICFFLLFGIGGLCLMFREWLSLYRKPSSTTLIVDHEEDQVSNLVDQV